MFFSHRFLSSILIGFWSDFGSIWAPFWEPNSVTLGIGVLMIFACRSKSGPRAPKSTPRAAKSRPRVAQERPRAAQEHPKSGPRAAYSGPRAAQERSKSGQEQPKSDQERLKSDQEVPKSSQEQVRVVSGCHIALFGGPQLGQSA